MFVVRGYGSRTPGGGGAGSRVSGGSQSTSAEVRPLGRRHLTHRTLTIFHWTTSFPAKGTKVESSLDLTTRKAGPPMSGLRGAAALAATRGGVLLPPMEISSTKDPSWPVGIYRFSKFLREDSRSFCFVRVGYSPINPNRWMALRTAASKSLRSSDSFSECAFV